MTKVEKSCLTCGRIECECQHDASISTYGPLSGSDIKYCFAPMEGVEYVE